jgi:hypothetical protein
MGMKYINTLIFKLSWWLFRWRLYQVNRMLKQVEREIVSRETKKRNEHSRVQDAVPGKMDARTLGNKNPVPSIPRPYAKATRR